MTAGIGTYNTMIIVTTVARCFPPLTAKCDALQWQTARKISIRYGMHLSAVYKHLQRHVSK